MWCDISQSVPIINHDRQKKQNRSENIKMRKQTFSTVKVPR